MSTKAIYSNYIHTSKTSGKSYIGVSGNPEKRKHEHVNASFNPNRKEYNGFLIINQ